MDDPSAVYDWLDLWGTALAGKTLGTDLLQRKPTLPTIRLLAAQLEEKQRTLIETLDSGAASVEMRRHLDQSDASAYSLHCARGFVTEALRDLHQVPPSAARSCLEGIAKLCISRAA